MERILHDLEHSKEILKLTSDTIIWLNKDGVCLDILWKEDVCFLNGNEISGKSFFDLFPTSTSIELKKDFQHTIVRQKKISREYSLSVEEKKFYFKCIFHPYKDGIICQIRDITGYSNDQIELDKVNRQLSTIQKTALLGSWYYNSKEGVIYFQGHTGIMTTEEIRRMLLDTYLNFVIAEDKQALKDWLNSNIEGGPTDRIEYRINFNDEIYYVRASANTRELQADGSVFLEGYIQNITDIKRSRNDINTLTHAINNATDSIFAARRDGTLIFANRKFRKNHLINDQTDISTLKIYELVGDMTTTEDWKKRMSIAESTSSTHAFTIYSPLLHNKDTLAFEGTIHKVTADDGEETFWSFTHDITERIRYERKLKRLTRIFDVAIDNLPASVVVKDIQDDFRYIYRNRESYNREVAMDDAIGKNDFDFYPQEIAQQKYQEDIDIATTGKKRHWLIEEKDRNGNMVILDKQKIKVETEDLSPLIISIEWDVTQLELMKREMKASKERAELSDKLKSAFLANMSHEIRTPLNAIVGFSRIISESESKDERQEYYKIVEANNERLLQLINEILDLSKIESGIVEFTLGPVHLHTLCKEIHDAHIFRCPAGVNLILEESDPAIHLHSDKNRLFQVFSNLIGNAFKFTKEGSVRYGYRKEGNELIFYVTDTGTGIAEEKLATVFDRFVKANNIVQGTGLGLSICKTIIEKLDGNISVESEVGKGTTFTFTLPYKPAKEIITKEQINLDESVNSEGKPKVLVAEDKDSNYELLYSTLYATYELVRAHDGMEAVTKYEEVKPDLILMDIHMPNLDGLSATHIIRELSADIPILTMSMFSNEAEQKEAYEAGATDLIHKPIDPVIVTTQIKKYLKS